MAQLEGQVALVTGGGSGIGRAVVDRYVEEGARVGIMDISVERLAELSRLYGERVIGVQGDAITVEANEKAVSEGVVSVRGAWRPPGLLRRECIAHAIPVVEGVLR